MSRMGTGGNQVPLVLMENNKAVCNSNGTGIAPALDSSYYKGAGCRSNEEREFVAIRKTYTMQALGEYSQGGAGSALKQRDYKDATDLVVEKEPGRKYVVRRLTPLECCRLQGFPDWWEYGVKGSDSNRFKMWGNGVSLPCVVDVLYRIVKFTEGE